MSKEEEENVPFLPGGEVLPLAALAKLGEANNVEIFDAVREAYPSASFPTTYAALVRLAHKGYVEVRIEERRAVRGGRARKFYKLTPMGARVLAANREILAATVSMWDPAIMPIRW